ncbi:MAG: choice-of-anchor D domain-containing protein [Gemmatimonadota bacterium]|nr:MAG: choice-of-anchor D domain-containing protein [Gemmatimonadota bacterium]
MVRRICFGGLLLLFLIPFRSLCAQEATLTVLPGSGERGTSGNGVEIALENDGNLQRIFFNIQFDPNILTVTSAQPGPRIDLEVGLGFNWSRPESGTVRVALTTVSGVLVPPGDGVIATVYFEVSEDAPVEPSPLTLSGVTLYESVSQLVPATLVNGLFSVFLSPHLGVSEDGHDFGGVLVGSSNTWTLTVSNAGTDTLFVDGLTSSHSEFDLELPSFPQVLMPDESFDVIVTFTPTEMAAVAGSLLILSNDPDDTEFALPLSGEGILPDIALSHSSYDFGNVPLASAVEWIFTIYNEGTAPLLVTDVSTDHPAFSVLSPNFPQLIGEGDSLEVTVAFQSETEGAESATLTVRSADPDEGTLRISLSAEAVKMPDIEVADTSHDFGQLLVQTSSEWVLGITNAGSEQLIISRIEFDSADFLVISHAFPQFLPAGERLDITIMFTPSVVGIISAQATIVSDDPDEENVIVSLSGEGVAPDIALSAAGHDFGGVIVGDSEEWVLTISNDGSGPLTVNSVSSDHSDFSVTSPSFPQMVAIGENIDVTITFEPTGQGTESATLTVSSNDPDEPSVRLSLDGEALVPDLEVSALSYDFGDVLIDSLSVLTLVLTNVGTGPVTIAEVETGHPDVSVASPSFPRTIEVGNSVNLILHYVPTSRGSLATQLIIRSNDPSEGTMTLELTGIGAPPITLLIERITGEPGEHNLTIPITLDNVVPVAHAEFSIHYDSAILTVTDVTQSGRGADMGTFSWSEIHPGQIVVLLSDFSGQVIPYGIGPIAELSVTVSELAPPRTIFFTFAGLAFFDAFGLPFESRALDGLFTVLVEEIALPITAYDFGEVGVALAESWPMLIQNVGTQELIIDSTISDNPDFTVTSPVFPVSIPPSGNIAVTVVFTPSTLGERVGHLTIANSDPDEGQAVVTLRGEGTAVAVLEVGGGSGEAGSTGNLIEVLLHNKRDVFGFECVLTFDAEKLSVAQVVPTDRSEPLGLFSWTTPTSGQVRIVITSIGGAFIPPGDGSVADVSVSVAQGAVVGEVSIFVSGVQAFDSDGDPLVSSGIGGSFMITGADIDLSEMSHAFGNVAVGDSGLWRMLLFNVGTSPLTLSGMTSDNPAFTVTGPEFPHIIPAGDSLGVNVFFVPTEPGAVVGSLVVANNDPDESILTVLLTGTGTVPDISVPVREYSFGSVGLGQSQEWLLTLLNRGLSDLRIFGISTDRSEFEVAWPRDFPQIVIPGGSLGAIIRFVPIDTGLTTGTLEVRSNDPDEPSLLIQLSGESEALVPDIVISSGDHDFGSVAVGGSADWVFTISNAGMMALTVQSVAPRTAEFSIVSPLFPRSVQPGMSISVVVLFSPSSFGPQQDTLTITSDDPDEDRITLPVRGSGVSETIPEITLSAYSHDFGRIAVGQTLDWELSISNEGTDDLTVTSVQSSLSEFSVVSPPFPQTVPPGGMVPVLVRFAPLSVGDKDGVLTISSNDPDEDTITVHISGEGLPATSTPSIAVSATEYNFGLVRVGQESRWSFEISNPGLADLVVSSAQSDHADFQVISPAFPVTIVPSGQRTVEVVFAPSSEGLKAGALAISSNDPDNLKIYVLVSGTGQRVVGVQLLSFLSLYEKGRVIVTWTTSSDADQTEFRLYRKRDVDRHAQELAVQGTMTGSNPYRYVDQDVEHEGLYEYLLALVDDGGEELLLGRTSTNIDHLEPCGMSLDQNYPTPFNPETKIGYTVARGGWVTLAVYDVLGRRVKTLVAQSQKAGYYSVAWQGDDDDGRTVHSGIYIAQLEIGDHVESMKMMFLK